MGLHSDIIPVRPNSLDECSVPDVKSKFRGRARNAVIQLSPPLNLKFHSTDSFPRRLQRKFILLKSQS